ncbi:MAG TPA: tRNA uridine-5-carboxymethylaminomethyl(34) synthesis GTPase MnmE [Rhodospirillales bacterium]|nr:tRNA uridine-5-carboxymethylaminomethyl(34) synthesis GTPase MnmE [Rhodospirillales bacterium]
MAETIFAPATAPGRAAIGILRISGPEAATVCRRLSGAAPPPPRRASLRLLRDPESGEPLDRALLLWFAAPASYTGEDLLEIQHHGGPAVLAALLDALAALPGLRPAEPGEFSRRAFLNGRLDLTAAEGIADLVEARTRAQARAALAQAEGALARACAGWREAILEASALIEAEIDFGAEEGDVPEDLWQRIGGLLAPVREAMRREAVRAVCGERLRAGVTVAVVGPPNVGKSSLVNLLARREVAIVTPLAGTTRDVLEVDLELDGLPVTLLDTAGLREAADVIEAEGIRRARARAEAADLRLFVVDPDTVDEAAAAVAPCLLVFNKADLAPPPALPEPSVAISCRDGRGIDRLLAWLGEEARALVGGAGEALFNRARHRAALTEAAEALERAERALAEGAELALPAEDLRLARRALGRITGEVGVEEVLDRIFARFCIGK